MKRLIQPEILDGLPPENAEAIQSRRDLERLNRIMRNARLLAKGMAALPKPPSRIVEMGSGDGKLLLQALRRLPPPEQEGRITFLDIINLITPEVEEAYAALGWTVSVKTGDVRETLTEEADLVLANLFLHHFETQALTDLLSQIRTHTKTFICVEPRRSRFAARAASLVRLIGCNRVTQHDAVVSVGAGFRDTELSDMWGQHDDWSLDEKLARPFSHFFLATMKR